MSNLSNPIITEWIKASASNDTGTCVQMRRNGEQIQVRDSKLGDESPVLTFSKDEFASWLNGAQKQEFTHLAE